MSWSETHRRLAALREIEAELDRRGDGRLPWSPEYASVFGDRCTLLLQLRYRWRLVAEAQGEAVAERHRGLLAVLRRHSWELAEHPEVMGAAL
jgi:hypothetical protein